MKKDSNITETTESTKMKTLIAAVLILFSSMVSAENAFYVGGFTWHPFNKHMNSDTRLVAVEYHNIFVAYDRNSYYRDTFIAGYAWHKQLTTNIEGTVMAGADYGYTNCIKGESENPADPKKVCGYVAGGFTYTKYQVKPTILFFGPSITLTTQWPFK